MSLAFELIGYLKEETDPLPWKAFLHRIKFFDDLYDSPRLNTYSPPSTSSRAKYELFQQYMSQLVEPIYDKVAWKSEHLSWTDKYVTNIFY